jgi:hypothetical protein
MATLKDNFTIEIKDTVVTVLDDFIPSTIPWDTNEAIGLTDVFVDTSVKDGKNHEITTEIIIYYTDPSNPEVRHPVLVHNLGHGFNTDIMELAKSSHPEYFKD